MNYLQMLEDINKLVETDFCEDMSMRANITHDHKHYEISQTDARTMANILGSVYLISHATHCGSCGSKYRSDSTPPEVQEMKGGK